MRLYLRQDHQGPGVVCPTSNLLFNQVFDQNGIRMTQDKPHYKILHVSASDVYGGAARASYRIYKAQCAYGARLGLFPMLRVGHSITNDQSIISKAPFRAFDKWMKFRLFANRLYKYGFRTQNPVLHSTAWLPSGYLPETNQKKYGHDLIHLHWLGDWMYSIEEIGRIQSPIVWTMHDQWAFLGAEHYIDSAHEIQHDLNIKRYLQSYSRSTRPRSEKGPDINRRTWLRKSHSWRKPINLVCSSNWMVSAVRASSLMSSWPVHLIPYPLDLDVWAPVEKAKARMMLQIPQDERVLLFGATGGVCDPRKGGDILFSALRIYNERINQASRCKTRLIIFGQDQPSSPPVIGFPILYAGTIDDDLRLRLFYSAADLMIVPSRLEAFGQTASEAHACGTPVVAFRTGGLIDIVDDQVTGILAEPYDPLSLALAIEAVLLNSRRCHEMGLLARQRAERLWHPARIASSHADLYRSILINETST